MAPAMEAEIERDFWTVGDLIEAGMTMRYDTFQFLSYVLERLIMPAWFGYVLSTILAGFIALLLVKRWKEKKIWDARRDLLDTVRQQLQTIRLMCTEAIDSKEGIKTEAAKQFARSVAYMILTSENHIEAILKPGRPQ